MKFRRIHKYKYQLVESCTVWLPGDVFADMSVDSEFALMVNNHLIIKEGYAWDGPSGPTIDTGTFMVGSLAHDVLYQLMREGLLLKSFREAADDVLRDVCIANGMNRIRAWYVHKAVRMFAGGSVKPRFDEIIEV